MLEGLAGSAIEGCGMRSVALSISARGIESSSGMRSGLDRKSNGIASDTANTIVQAASSNLACRIRSNESVT